MPEKIWIESFKVRSDEIDARGSASVQTICRYLQETAGNHVEDCGFAIDQLLAQGLTWILARIHIHVHRYPSWRERIRVETWPPNAFSFYAYRDFCIYNEQDHLLVSATSLWLVLDLTTYHPIRIPEDMLKMAVPKRGRAIDDPLNNLWRPQQITVEKQFHVRLSDLDMNQHVNNVSYIEWAIETIPSEVWQAYELEELEVSFRSESKYGDLIISQSEQIPQDDRQVFTHRIGRGSDGVELFLARTAWRKTLDMTRPVRLS